MNKLFHSGAGASKYRVGYTSAAFALAAAFAWVMYEFGRFAAVDEMAAIGQKE